MLSVADICFDLDKRCQHRQCQRMFKTPKLVEFESKPALQEQAADWISSRLEDALSRRGLAVFMGAGGSTPGPVYERLSHAKLDWSNVIVGLTDERWVDPDHPASNGAMMTRTLLQNNAAIAEYIPMKADADHPIDAIAEVSDAYLDAQMTDVMLIGMGPDAHTLSWFAGAEGYDEAVDPDTVLTVAAIEAIESDVTGPHTTRMTLTLPCISHARDILLLITGQEKKTVFDTAADTTPIGYLKRAAGSALTIFYAP